MRLLRSICTCALVALFTMPAFAQTGKIAGTVTDASTGESLPGVNVVIEGTTQGAVTDVDGFYNIIGVRPGTHTLQASFIGFTTQSMPGVRVNIDLTSTVDFQLQEETVGLDEVVVAATRPIVQADVSANVANISSEDVENLPVAGLSEVLDLQAGIEPNLTIRGGGSNEVAFIVDGMNMRTGRNQRPMTNISYTSIEEVQVQTGGFSAKYGNVRSGIVNVATKEPPRNSYTFDGLFRYAPPADKVRNAITVLPDQCSYATEADLANVNCNNWFVRPFLDPDVNMGGTDAWDPYIQRQYRSFTGWENRVGELQDLGFDVNAADMIEYFKHVHRKDNTVDIPDYDADFTFGGPLIPGLSQKLGDLRFLASYRGTQTAYALPQTRDAFRDQTFQLKVISNIRPGMRLSFNGLRSSLSGQTDWEGEPDVSMYRGDLPAYPWHNVDTQIIRDIDDRGDEIYSDAVYALADIDYTMFGGSFTHTLSPSTFYEVSVQRLGEKHRSSFPNLRDENFVCPESGLGPNGSACDPGAFVNRLYTDQFGNLTPLGEANPEGVTCFGGDSDLNEDGTVRGFCSGDEPFGFAAVGGNLVSGEALGGHWVKTRDTSDVAVWTSKFDLTSQVNRFLQIETGAELIYSNYDMNYAQVTLGLVGPEPEENYAWDRSPLQGAAYAQGKLEFQGMVANIGMRLDYFDANTDWWVYDTYPEAFRFQVDQLNELLEKEPTNRQITLSPRIGISFPITEGSKLYFNYGHFRQMLSPHNIFGIQMSKTSGIQSIGNPNHPMPKTVAYELGFDQNLFDLFLLRVSGFYQDKSDQQRSVTFESLGGTVVYDTYRPWNYEDVRGAEFTLTKNRGDWVRGFANYTYLQTKSGNFGFDRFYENEFQFQTWLQGATDYRLDAPIAEPFARANIVFMLPEDFGPEVAGAHPLADFRLSFLGEWRAGKTFTWTGSGNIPELRNNAQTRSYKNVDMRLTKNINSIAGDIQLFMDVTNVLNRRHFYIGHDPSNVSGSSGAFLEGAGGRDGEQYMMSLHMPADIGEGHDLPYMWIPGDDKAGDYRKPGVDFQPMVAVSALPVEDEDNPVSQLAWYWTEDGGYQQWNGTSWSTVSQGDVDQALDDKAYIDMPNNPFMTFFNPRRVLFGIRYTF